MDGSLFTRNTNIVYRDSRRSENTSLSTCKIGGGKILTKRHINVHPKVHLNPISSKHLFLQAKGKSFYQNLFSVDKDKIVILIDFVMWNILGHFRPSFAHITAGVNFSKNKISGDKILEIILVHKTSIWH